MEKERRGLFRFPPQTAVLAEFPLTRNVLRARTEELPIVVSRSLSSSSAMPLIKQHCVACCPGGVVMLPVRQKTNKKKAPRCSCLWLCTTSTSCLLRPAAAAAALVLCVIIGGVSSTDLHFRNAHKGHARNAKATRRITMSLRIHSSWVVNPGTPACVLTAHPVFDADQIIVVGFSNKSVASAGRFCHPSRSGASEDALTWSKFLYREDSN